MRFYHLFFTIFLVFSSAGAKPLPPLSPKLIPVFELIKNAGVNYKPDGTVCEQVASLQAAETFPPDRYAITTGVVYEIGDGALGELDLVVVNRQTKAVELVAEVKCWHDFSAAMDKASAQRDRFLWNLSQFPEKILFNARSREHQFAETHFRELKQFIFISQAGGVKKGFDQEIPFTLSELKALQENLVRCQNSGKCPLEKANP